MEPVRTLLHSVKPQQRLWYLFFSQMFLLTLECFQTLTEQRRFPQTPVWSADWVRLRCSSLLALIADAGVGPWITAAVSSWIMEDFHIAAAYLCVSQRRKKTRTQQLYSELLNACRWIGNTCSSSYLPLPGGKISVHIHYLNRLQYITDPVACEDIRCV